MISVVIPAYCEGKNVERAIAEVGRVLAAINEKTEIIVVDDGSPDNTFEIANRLTSGLPNLKVLQHEINKGPGAAFRTGFKNTEGDVVITIDCDLSFDPNQIPKLLEGVKTFDVVIGAQHGDGSEMANIPWVRIFCSKLAYFFDRMILGGNLDSYSSFFVAYKGDVIRSLHFSRNGFDAQCEIFVKLLRQGRTMMSVPCRLAWRDKNRNSSMKLFREAKKRFTLWMQYNRFRSV